MPLGELFGISQDGIKLTSAQARMLDLRENDVVWGQWVEGRGGREKMQLQQLDAEDFDARAQGPHLVVSSIHPDLWVSALRLEARLTHDDRAIDYLLADLAGFGANVLFIETGNAGFDLQIAEIVFHLPRLDQACRTILAGIPHEENPQVRLQERIRAFRDIGERVNACGFAIQTKLRYYDLELCKGEGHGFLHKSTKRDGGRPWYLDYDQSSCIPILDMRAREFGIIEEQSIGELLEVISTKLSTMNDLTHPPNWPFSFRGGHDPYLSDRVRCNMSERADRHWRDCRRDPIRVHGMTTLAYARVWRAYRDAKFPHRLEFKLKGKKLAIRPDGQDWGALGPIKKQFRVLTQCHDPELEWYEDWPSLGTYNRSERFVRLRLIRRKFAHVYAWHIEIPYQMATEYANGDVPDGPAVGDSRGLAACVTEAFLESQTLGRGYDSGYVADAMSVGDVVIERMSNRITRSEIVRDGDEIHRALEDGIISLDIIVNAPAHEDFENRVRAVVASAAQKANEVKRTSKLSILAERVRVHTMLDDFLYFAGEGETQ